MVLHAELNAQLHGEVGRLQLELEVVSSDMQLLAKQHGELDAQRRELEASKAHSAALDAELQALKLQLARQEEQCSSVVAQHATSQRELEGALGLVQEQEAEVKALNAMYVCVCMPCGLRPILAARLNLMT